MNRILLLAITTTSVMALGSACVIKTSDSTSSGNGGSSTTSTSTGEGGTGGAGAQGGGGAAGVGGSGMGGAGGGGTCATCNDYVYGEATEDELCESSIELVNALGLCSCGDGANEPGMCATDCVQSCTGEGMNADTCDQCVQTNCNAEYNACTGDTGGQ